MGKAVLFAKKANVKNPIAYSIISFLVRNIMQVVSRRDWQATEKLNIDGGIIVCANHLSYFDPMALAHYLHDNGRPPRFLAKSGIFKYPLIGNAIKAAGQIPVFRGTAAARDSLVAAEAALHAGNAVVIYPEGTLTYDPNLWPMTGATGAARVALATKYPVIPVGQWGPQHVISPAGGKANFHARHIMHIKAGDPVDLSDLFDQPIDAGTLAEATNRIMHAIAALVGELRNETPPTELWDRRVQPDGSSS